MKDRELKKFLRQSLQNLDGENAKLEETVKLCTEIVREQKSAQNAKEARTNFVQYLSDIFRFEGIPIFGLQAVTLLLICLTISAVAGNLRYIPVFMPLLVLAVVPVMFRGQYYGMSEIEAVTRASGSQVALAKLVLAGAANLVGMTVLISFEVYIQNSYREIRQMILYCLVPYLVCMASMLRLIRLQGKENIQICTLIALGSCVGWGVLARTLPWLYDASAFGLWITAFLFFAVFFTREIHFMITMRKEGKMYGIIV